MASDDSNHFSDEDLFRLVRQFSKAKEAESTAAAYRVSVERDIIALTGFSQASGSKTYRSKRHDGSFKITLTQPVSSTVIEDEVARVRRSLGEKFGTTFKTKHTVIAKGLAALDPAQFLIAKSGFVTKPGKIGLELKNLEVDNDVE